jgi:hypothetical protein
MFSSPFGIGAPPPAASANGEGATTAPASAAAASALLMRAIEDTTEPMLARTEPMLARTVPKLCMVGLKIGNISGTNSEAAADARDSNELASFAWSTRFSAVSESQSVLIFIHERRQSH